MKKEKFPCHKCIIRPICQNITAIECSELFFMIMDNSDFEDAYKIRNEDLKRTLKQLMPAVISIRPGKDWLNEEKNIREKSLQKHLPRNPIG